MYLFTAQGKNVSLLKHCCCSFSRAAFLYLLEIIKLLNLKKLLRAKQLVTQRLQKSFIDICVKVIFIQCILTVLSIKFWEKILIPRGQVSSCSFVSPSGQCVLISLSIETFLGPKKWFCRFLRAWSGNSCNRKLLVNVSPACSTRECDPLTITLLGFIYF